MKISGERAGKAEKSRWPKTEVATGEQNDGTEQSGSHRGGEEREPLGPEGPPEECGFYLGNWELCHSLTYILNMSSYLFVL